MTSVEIVAPFRQVNVKKRKVEIRKRFFNSFSVNNISYFYIVGYKKAPIIEKYYSVISVKC